MKLPIVSKEVGTSVRQEIIEIEDKECYTCQLLEKLEKDNPYLGLFISNYAAESSDEINVMICALLVYRMLESQAEADEMNEIFK